MQQWPSCTRVCPCPKSPAACRAAGPPARRNLPRLAPTRRVQMGPTSPTGMGQTLILRSLRPLHAS
eukprot:11198708-Lingulodinium_polyedra.AAC.1